MGKEPRTPFLHCIQPERVEDVTWEFCILRKPCQSQGPRQPLPLTLQQLLMNELPALESMPLKP